MFAQPWSCTLFSDQFKEATPKAEEASQLKKASQLKSIVYIAAYIQHILVMMCHRCCLSLINGQNTQALQ